jgi:hypothetical protein
MRMIAGWTLIALAIVILFVELFSLFDTAPAFVANAAFARPVPWYEHALWFAASAALLALGAWLARDWRRRYRGTA